MTRGDKQAFGRMGEKFVADGLRDRGCHVLEVGTRSRTDLIVNGNVTVEVKAATLTKRRVQRGGEYNHWHFSFRRNGLPNDSDFAVLVCFGDDMEAVGSFVIPGYAVGMNRRTVKITREDPEDYSGKWAEFYERWDALLQLVEDRKDQDPVPEKEEDPIPF